MSNNTDQPNENDKPRAPLSDSDIEMRMRIVENQALELCALVKLRLDSAAKATTEGNGAQMLTVPEAKAWLQKTNASIAFMAGAESRVPSEQCSLLWFELQDGLRTIAETLSKLIAEAEETAA